MRYALVEMGGKRIRPVICLATGEALGAEPETVLPAALALELVHNFSLVHDDLPALDDDAERRGKPSVWAAFGEGKARARRRRAARGGVPARVFVPNVRRRARARRGDARHDRRPVPRHDGAGRRPRDGAPSEDGPPLLRVGDARARGRSRCRPAQQRPWRAFADELGMLFQVVDDILDGDGFVVTLGVDGARRLADDAAARARAALEQVDADTSVLAGIVDDLAVRTV